MTRLDMFTGPSDIKLRTCHGPGCVVYILSILSDLTLAANGARKPVVNAARTRDATDGLASTQFRLT